MLHKINFKQHFAMPFSAYFQSGKFFLQDVFFAEKNLKIPSGTNKIIRMVGGWKAPHIQQ
jgi:hypothetical protein